MNLELTWPLALRQGIASANQLAIQCLEEGDLAEARRHMERAEWYASSLELCLPKNRK